MELLRGLGGLEGLLTESRGLLRARGGAGVRELLLIGEDVTIAGRGRLAKHTV